MQKQNFKKVRFDYIEFSLLILDGVNRSAALFIFLPRIFFLYELTYNVKSRVKKAIEKFKIEILFRMIALTEQEFENKTNSFIF